MTEEHIGLVYTIAQELANTNELCIRAFGRDVQEYLGEAYIGLQIAKKKFKPELGFKFSTYAGAVIKKRLIRAAAQSTLVKVSSQARYQAIQAIKGEEVPPEHDKKVKDALRVMCKGVLSLSGDNDITGTVGQKNDSPIWEVLEEVNRRLDELDDRTKSVLVMRYGLDGNEPLTLEEIGKKLEPPVTRERVRQIENAGLVKLRESINL